MERLTTRIEDKVYYAKGKYAPTTLCVEMTTTNVRECMKKLAEYEDIGLTPTEIKYFLKDFGITVTKRNRELIKELQEYRSLKVEGRLIKLPCKVGDMVYEANITRNIISSYRVTSIVVMADSTYYNWELVKEIYSNLNGFNELEIDEVVFLTREEAEKTLEECSEVKGE